MIARAVRFLEVGSLRALDALQLGCAAEAASEVFLSADDRQIEAGRAAGMAVVDVRG